MGSVLGPQGICSKVVKEVHHGGHGPIFRILSWDWIGPNHISSKHRVCVASWLQKIRQWSKFTAGILLFAIYNRQFLHTYLHDNDDVPYVAFYIRVILIWIWKVRKSGNCLRICIHFIVQVLNSVQCLKITQNIAFEFWHFPPIFDLLKLTCLVTLFDRKL